MGLVNYNVGIHGPLFEQYVNKSTQEVKLSGTDRLEIFMSDLEKGLDYAGGIPGLSTASGAFRVLYGLTQLVSAVALQIVGVFGEVFSDVKDFGYWQKFSNRADMHAIEGLKNIGRGLSEAVPLVNLFWWIHLCERDKISSSNSGPHVYEIGVKDPQSQENTTFRTLRNFYDGELKKKIILEHLIGVSFTKKSQSERAEEGPQIVGNG